MSKVKRISSKKSIENKVINHYSSLSLMNHKQALGELKLATDKQDSYTESPYAKKLSKIRSTSILKDPSFLTHSGLVSPPLNPKFSMNLKSKINLSSSFISKKTDSTEAHANIKKKTMVIHRNKSENQTCLIELKLDEVCNKHREFGISGEILDKYRECFEEIIANDKVFGSLLSKIKFAYEDWVNQKVENLNENSKLKSDIVEFSRKLTEEIDENKRLHRKVQKISRENVEFGRLLEERENHCKELQEHLVKITNIEIDEVPLDKVSWKVLVAENRNYSELCGKMKKKIKSLKIQEKKLLKLFWIFKQKGYPVEEIYESFNVRKKQKQLSIPLEDVSDNEAINIDPLISRPKPGNVPLLKMSKVEPNSFTERNSESGDESKSQ